jgi:hypothetical protein
VNSASELIHSHWFFEIKKKTVHFSEQLQWSHAPLLLFFPDDSPKPAVPCWSYSQKYFYFDYQTLINMITGEPHPQPRYQTTSN